MSGNCAIIVCDHGLGHLRRCALIAKQLEAKGGQVILFSPSESVERLVRAVPSLAGLRVYNFATRTIPEKIRKGKYYAIEWLGRIPSLDVFDSVFCDNLPEILAIRPDSILSAQFFWHDVIEDAAPSYIDYCTELLNRHKPTIIGSEPFAMASVRKQPGYKPVKLYKIPELITSSAVTSIENKTDLLVTGGTTLAIRTKLQHFINILLSKGPGQFTQVHVDPELFPKNPPAWMVKANFKVDMYCKLKAAICRPGLGVLTDLLTVNSQILPVYEMCNSEMSHNHSVLVKYFPDNVINSDKLKRFGLSSFCSSCDRL